ncbi:MAG: Gfo/Idh/MocA family oxidoreductase [Isosphaeraceae bacterium]
MGKVVEADDRARLAEFPGGMMFELGCHLIDLVVGFLGRPDSVSPHLRTTRSDSLADNAVAVLEYPKALATISSSALEVEGFARRHLTILGTEGSLTIEPLDQPAVRLALSQARGEYRKGYQTITLPKYDRYVADAHDIARVIRGEKPPDWSPRHDLVVQETVLLASAMPIDR